MYIIAVEIKEDMVFSEHFTDELARKYNKIKKEVVAILNRLIPQEIMQTYLDNLSPFFSLK